MRVKNIVFMAVLLIFCACSDSKVSTPQNLNFTSPDGKKISVVTSGSGRIKNVKIGKLNKPFVAVYWATHCKYCVAEIPHLVKLYSKYKDRVDFFAPLAENKPAKEIQDFAKYHNVNYDILMGDDVFVLAKAMGGVRGIPAIFIFDKNGEMSSNFVGAVTPEILEKEIKKLL